MYVCMCTDMHVQSKSYLITAAGRNTISDFHRLQCFAACVLIHITARKHCSYILKSSVVHLYNNIFQIQISIDLKLHDVDGDSVW